MTSTHDTFTGIPHLGEDRLRRLGNVYATLDDIAAAFALADKLKRPRSIMLPKGSGVAMLAAIEAELAKRTEDKA